VESPSDVIAFEQSGVFQGRYFVLHGHLSPIDGIGPKELGIVQLQEQLQAGDVSELILATNSTVEGEATAHYIGEIAKATSVSVTRLAQGVPFGGELEYLDGSTLAHALNSRTKVE
jgi:recombination protein RecR